MNRGRILGLGLFAALALLAIPAAADAFQAKTNRGGKCTVRPIVQTKGENEVTYGLEVPKCSSRNGIRVIGSSGIAVEGRQVVSGLQRKLGKAPYENKRTSPRTAPDPPPGPPVIPPLPPLPEPPLPDLPIIDIPTLPDLPDLFPGDKDGSARTYSRVDFSLQLKRNRGKRARRKPEKWRKRPGCVRELTRYAKDTLVCQFFATTG